MDKRILAQAIQKNLNEVTNVFGKFQNESGLHCPEGCGKCCLKADISCAPYELLPMAYHLIETGKAESILEKAQSHSEDNCLFLEVRDRSLGLGRCTEYEHRPFICRAFGLSARQGKHQTVERLICKTLAELESLNPTHAMNVNDIPLIDLWKKKFESLDPQLLNEEIPIHQGIALILEQLLLRESLMGLSEI